MRIDKLRTERRGDRRRVAATVTWEDCDRPPHDLYFETTDAFGDGLSANPHAFLAGSLLPAMRYGEDRIAVEDEICPEFLNGLDVIATWFWHWHYSGKRRRIRIEPRTTRRVRTSARPARAGLLFSGGIDSLATLRRNRLRFPPEHPGSIKDGLCVFGLEQSDPRRFEYVFRSVSRIAADAAISLIPVYTNVYLQYRDEDARNRFRFWALQLQGGALAAIGHAFAGRLSTVYVAATDAIPDLSLLHQREIPPYGTHPLIDPNYSSSDLRIHHDGIDLSRLQKIALIADWPIALQNLRVCNQFEQYEPDRLNCGRCEKCLRTMLGLLVIGKLQESRAFPITDVAAALIEKAAKLTPRGLADSGLAGTYRELLAPLRAAGRWDLARPLARRLRRATARRLFQRLLTGRERAQAVAGSGSSPGRPS
jgi:hypothetical protein